MGASKTVDGSANMNSKNKSLAVSEEALQKMFEHYIERRRYAQHSTGYNTIWVGGECDEAERWMVLFGIDISYERIAPMIRGDALVLAFDEATQVESSNINTKFSHPMYNKGYDDGFSDAMNTGSSDW